MNPKTTARGRGPALAVLAACVLTTSAPAAAQTATIATPKAGVSMAGAGKSKAARYGSKVRIRGALTPATAGRQVRLERSGRGGAWKTVAATATSGGGAYSFTVPARRSASYRAVDVLGGSASAPRRVIVRAKVAGRSARHVLGGRPVRVRGRLLPRIRGRKVAVQVRRKGRWRTVARTTTRRGGRFAARWRPRSVGRYRLRVRVAGDRSLAGAADVLRRVSVYRAGHASWYGPGFMGNRTACGQTLHGGLMGVAHKTLPCGSKVTFRYRGRTATARVVDRGPFIAGREWDLTPALKSRLRFGSTGTVWTTK